MTRDTESVFRGRPESARSAGNLLVMQVCISDAPISPLYRLSIERARAYARRTGADYRLITEGYAGYDPHFALFRAYEMRYAKILCLDCDAIVMDECPDIFELDEFAAAADASAQPGMNPRHYKNGVKGSLGIPKDHVYLNSGVVLFTRDFLDRTAAAVSELFPGYGDPDRNLANQKDQLLLNEVVGKHYGEFHVLEPDWNRWFEPTKARYIHHYAHCSRAEFDEDGLRKRLRPVERPPLGSRRIRFMAWSDRRGTELDPLLDSAKRWGIDVEIIGVGQRFEHGYFAKLDILEDAVRNLPPDEVVLCTDGHDVLYTEDADTILQKFIERNVPLVISAERRFTHQYTSLRAHFDREAPGSSYRYPNSGGMIGRADAILAMLDELRTNDRDKPNGHVWGDYSDGTLVGEYVARRPDKAVLDHECEFFWCTSSEWEMAAREAPIVAGRITNPTTQTQPATVHVPWRQRYGHLLTTLAERLAASKTRIEWKQPLIVAGPRA